MATFISRLRVEDYAHAKAVHLAAKAAREANGFQNEQFFRNPSDPHEMLILWDVEDLQQARAYGQSDEVQQRVRASGTLEVVNYYPD
jgi:hypothetical protein